MTAEPRASRGPAGRLLARLWAAAPGARMGKTALAVAVAWWLAQQGGEPRPLFAALGALVGMETTIVGSLRRTGLQLAGTLGGLALAFVIVNLMGVSWLAAGLAVLLGLWLGRWLGSPDRIGVELAFAALLVVGLAAGDPRFGLTRLWEAALGGLVAAVINALILPPDFVARLVDDLDALAAEIATGLRETASIFFERPRHEGAVETLERLRAAHATLRDAEAQLRLANEALLLNPRLPRRRPQLDRARVALHLYGRALHHVTSLARIVQEHAARPHLGPHPDLVGPAYLVQAATALARALEHYQAYVRTGAPDPLSDARLELARAQAALASFLDVAEYERAAETDVRLLIDIAALGSELEQMAADLAAVLDGVPQEPAEAVHAARL